MKHIIAMSLIVILAMLSFGRQPKTTFGQHQPGPIEWLPEIQNARELLRDIRLEHSTKLYTQIVSYTTPTRRHGRRRRRAVAIRYTDYLWKEAALAIFNPMTRQTKVIIISKTGKTLVNLDDNFSVRLQKRPSGLSWNGKNTAFDIVDAAQQSWVVIGIKWIERPPSGPTKEVLYVPYSTGLHVQELVQLGGLHLEHDIARAQASLDVQDVRSLVFPNKKVTSVISPRLARYLILNEQTDPTDFYDYMDGQWPWNPFERVLVRLAINDEAEFSRTISSAQAAGMPQFIKGSWNVVRRGYPAALLASFEDGISNHAQSIEAEILLCDYNLAQLVKAFGTSIFTDPDRDYYLAAAYHRGIGSVITAIRKWGKKWRDEIKRVSTTGATVFYLDKFDFLMRQPIAMPSGLGLTGF